MARAVELHPDAGERALERGASEDEIVTTVANGEQFPAKHGRTGFRRNFTFDGRGAVAGMVQSRSKPMPSRKMVAGS